MSRDRDAILARRKVFIASALASLATTECDRPRPCLSQRPESTVSEPQTCLTEPLPPTNTSPPPSATATASAPATASVAAQSDAAPPPPRPCLSVKPLPPPSAPQPQVCLKPTMPDNNPFE